jgi:hypothetical protein
MLAVAFDLGDPDKAAVLAEDVIAESQTAWKLQSILGDLKASVLQVENAAKPAHFSAIIDRIKSACPRFCSKRVDLNAITQGLAVYLRCGKGSC